MRSCDTQSFYLHGREVTRSTQAALQHTIPRDRAEPTWSQGGNLLTTPENLSCKHTDAERSEDYISKFLFLRMSKSASF
jgi:hypothetical protein